MITRIAKLKEFDNVIAGRDLLNIFKEGHVYSVTEIMGTIMIKDLGEHAIMEQYHGSGISGIMMDGSYCMTKEERQRQLSEEGY
jgi:hypothetical protein